MRVGKSCPRYAAIAAHTFRAVSNDREIVAYIVLRLL